MLTLKSTTEEPFVVLTAIGELDLHTQDLLEDTVTQHLERTPVVVDLGQVEFLAVSALRTLMVCNAMAGSNARELFFAGPPGQTKRLISIAGLDGVLPIRASVAEAICTSGAPTVPPVLVRSGAHVLDEALGDLAQLDVG